MAFAMNALTEPRIDAHCHVFDPAKFPYNPDAAYHPAGQEMGNAEYFLQLMACHGVRHALLVGPNSGYATDNRCLLHALQIGQGAFKGIAVVPNDFSLEHLQQLKAQGVIGIAFNPAMMGFDFYADIEPLLRRLQQLDMWAQLQVEQDLLLDFLPMFSRVNVKLMIDHCGRPQVPAGLSQPGFQALLALGREQRAVVKLSGFAKFSASAYPFADVRPHVEALAHDFGLSHCVWGSDWPFLRAPARLDYGPVLQLYDTLFTPQERHQLMWASARHHFGFGD